MDAPTVISPNADSDATVDATRPFRSVKEAVAIFGERLFLGEAKLSPRNPGFGVGKEISHTSEHQQSANRPSAAITYSRMDGEEVADPSFDDASRSGEITSLKVLPNNSTDQPVADLSLSKPSLPAELGSADKFPNPAGEQDVCSSLDGPSIPLEITESPVKPPVTPLNQMAISPMYELTPSPRNPRNESHGNIVHGNDLVMMLMVLRKLEAELQETKMELKLLKERGSETEVALASLNAELHKNMSKMAKAEAAEAGKAASKSSTDNEGSNREIEPKTEERARCDVMMKTIDSPTLAQILKISDYEGYFEESRARTKKLMKKRPIIPLVTDIFQWKKKPSPTHDLSSPIFSSQMYFA